MWQPCGERPWLDTHVWVWWMIGDARLKAKHRTLLDDLPESDRPCLASIRLWEVATLVELGRLQRDLPLSEWFALAAGPKTVRRVGLNPLVAAEAASLPSTFHRDPADRLIVSTSRILRLPLLTYDRLIRDARIATLAR